MRLLIDSHLDLAWNSKTYDRDYSLTTAEIRQKEAGSQVPLLNGDTLLGWDAFQRGQVALVFATLFAAPERARSHPSAMRSNSNMTQYYASDDQAYTLYRQQVDHYLRMFEQHPTKFQPVASRAQLNALLSQWQDGRQTQSPTGMVMLMEGAEGVRQMGELEEWWSLGVRMIGPAWMGNRFCGGTAEPGPLTDDGIRLLDAMVDFGFSLDLSHMDSRAALQALDHYTGPLFASHANAQALLKGANGNRHLPDEVIRGILARDGVIGIVPNNSFLLPGWKRNQPRNLVTLQYVVTQIDYICQLAGDAHHAGLGTDFDGGFGVQDVPEGIDTIADLHGLAPLLARKGYSENEINLILGGNWLAFLDRTLPESA